jgi:hypothetical protein
MLGAAAATAQSDGRGAPAPDLCAAFPGIVTDAQAFAAMFADSSVDLDDDGLHDQASLELVHEVACNSDAPVALSLSTAVAYNANLALFDAEAAAPSLAGFREAIAALMLTSAGTEAAVKAALALAVPPIALAADYTQVTCTAGVCLPVPVRDSSTGEFFEFTGTRAADEPYAGDGDLDGDGVTNVTEFNNIVAQGGSVDNFVVVATSPELDGTEPIRNSGRSSGGCFIATAAYGTPLATEIELLREWRDGALLGSGAGAALTDAYYRLSPPVARRVAESDVLAGAVRVALVPVIGAIRGEGSAEWIVFIVVPALALLGAIARRRLHS